MQAWILAVGSELLGPDRLDTNSLRLTEVLDRFGVELVGKHVIGDSAEEIAGALDHAIERAGLVLVTGGLGPTGDDLTREGTAVALDRTMEEDEAIVDDIRRRFRALDLEMPDVNRRQAQVIDGAEVLVNRRGTAPGLRLVEGGTTIFLLPGVPFELESMIGAHLEPWLEEHAPGHGMVLSGSLRVACRSESAVEEALEPLYDALDAAATLTILASPGDIEVRLRTTAGGRAGRERLESLLAEARRLLGDSVYGEGRDAKLEAVVGELLARRGDTVVTAESCTGGGVAERLTAVPGSSTYFLGGVVTYSDRLKEELLGVPGELLRRHGAVSAEVAESMARGVRRRLGGDYGIAVTGIAGPAGGSPDKPVGTVHVALALPGDGTDAEGGLLARRLVLPGDRQRVRRLTGQWALDMLRRALSRAGAG